MNAKSWMWWGEHADDRGEEVEDFVLRMDLRVLNEPGNLATFRDSRGHEVNIEVTLATKEWVQRRG